MISLANWLAVVVLAKALVSTTNSVPVLKTRIVEVKCLKPAVVRASRQSGGGARVLWLLRSASCFKCFGVIKFDLQGPRRI